MRQIATVADIFELFDARGDKSYGEDVTSLMHALQCAQLAQRDGASDELVAAALLHDVGHLVADVQTGEREDLENDDDIHEALGAQLIAPLLGPAVAQPISLHVTAKRWRCTVSPEYHDQLSDTSRATLKAQGGLLSAAECARFEAHPGHRAALALRDWDDEGKDPELTTADLESYRPLLERLAAQFAASR
jgi:phosphonate degradation associated HDIG domain protein